MTNAPTGLATPLSDRLTIRIDPSWPYWLEWGKVVNSSDSKVQIDPLKLAFTFIDLEGGIEESSAANYGDTDIIGRAEAYKTYISTSNKEIPLTFQFRAQGLSTSGPNIAEILQREVVRPARWLDALKYPIITQSGLSIAPPPCLLQVGSLFFGRVVATDVQISWQNPFDPATLLPHGAEVSVTFSVVRRVVGNYPMDGVWGARSVQGVNR